jgi:hypothetical protein
MSEHGAADDRAAEAIRVFDKDLGTWDTELQIRPGPGAEPITTKGRTVNRLVGGRWLVSDHTTESGFEGHGVYGWDADQGRYVAVWVDAAGGGMARGVGDWDEASRTMTYHFEVEHQGRKVRYRELTETQDDGSLAYRNLMATPDGGEYEAITATYRRP